MTINNSEKIALIFPGLGYNCDKPLLYYPKKIAASYGYQIIEINYSGFPSNVKGNKEKMELCFNIAFEQTKTCLSSIDFNNKDILIIGKSIGTAVAAAYASKILCSFTTKEIRFIYLTPVEQSFNYMRPSSGIVFHGTSDPWINTPVLVKNCENLNLPLFITKDSNHSLETGNLVTDIENLGKIMGRIDAYIQNSKS